MYGIKFNRRSSKFFENAPRDVSRRVLEKIKALGFEPVPHGAKKIIGVKDKVFRIRVGDYRVLYVVNHEENEIYITNIDKRERVYE